MAENSRIEWTDHTFNPWWGCTKVSPACDNCYAEAWAKRTGHTVWGAKQKRRFLSDSYWRQPLRWQREAEAKGKRARVFCASMADVFEWRSDLSSVRKRLWDLIDETPYLDWLLLTKRPHLVKRLAPWRGTWPDNIWLGATVESQTFVKKRMHHLVDAPAKVHFLSCEPLRSRLNLEPWLSSGRVDWVIAGGESGPNARPTEPNWFRELRDQCLANSVAFHFKQWGDWAPLSAAAQEAIPNSLDMDACSEPIARFGKKRSGRVLDGREWNQLPATIVSSEESIP